jgi:hypothetical protein
MSAPAPHAAIHAAAPMSGHLAAAPHAPAGGHYVRTRSGAIVFRPGVRAATLSSRVNGSRRVLSQDIPVPGLGFDYPHLAAIGGGRGNRNFLGNNRNRPFLAFFPFYGGGYYLPLYDDNDDTSAGQEQADAGQQDYYPQYPAPPRPGDTAEGLPAPAPVQTAEAERPADEYVFVRRDGTLFFAVAYTWDNGNLRYVTGEGLRRSVAGDTLDLNATQQFNEQRGLNFRVPTA